MNSKVEKMSSHAIFMRYLELKSTHQCVNAFDAMNTTQCRFIVDEKEQQVQVQVCVYVAERVQQNPLLFKCEIQFIEFDIL